MNDYIRNVQYHETDKMGITYHSNYIKWMEEARVDFLEQIGFGYAKLEADGIISPVIGVNCDYRRSTTFGDTVSIKVEIEHFERLKLIIRYTMKNVKTDEIVAAGSTSHCFLNEAGRPVLLSKMFPDFDAALKSLVAEK